MTVKEFYEYMKSIGAEDYVMYDGYDAIIISDKELAVFRPDDGVDDIGRVYI